MELQIQKDLVSTGFDLPNDLRPFGIGFLPENLSRKANVSSLLLKSQAMMTSFPISGHLR